MPLTLPDSGAPEAPDGRRTAPSALRNLPHIGGLLASYAPTRGTALEIASGTGQQIAHFAAAHPGLDWQPTDRDAGNFPSIAAWRAEANLPNLRAPLLLDAARPGWGRSFSADLVLAVNLLHLISDTAADAVLTGMAEALLPGGMLLIYGPFLRDGSTTSPGDAEFHASLQAQDPAIGYKDARAVSDRLATLGLPVEVTAMPANNLALLGRKS